MGLTPCSAPNRQDKTPALSSTKGLAQTLCWSLEISPVPSPASVKRALGCH